MDDHSYLRGRLEDVHFPDLLLEISQRRETGILHLIRQQIEKDIYFQDGRIVFAKSNDPDQRLGELLLRRGKISLRQFHDSASKIVPGVRLGTILVQDGYLKAADLYQGVVDQVEEIVYSVFEWSDGDYEFRKGNLPGKEVITLSISTPDIINIGIGRIWKWSWIGKGVGPLDTVFTRRKEWSSIARKMLITPVMQSLIELLEQPLSLEGVLKTSRINSYETCKLLWVLLSIGIIEKMPRMEVVDDLESAPDEVAELPPTPPPEHQPTEIIAWQPRRLPPATPEFVDSAPPVPERELPLRATTVEMPAPSQPISEGAPESSEPVSTAVPFAEFPAAAPAVTVAESTPSAPSGPEPGAAPTVEISFSDLAEFTDSVPQTPQNVPDRPVEIPDAKIGKDIAGFNEIHRYLFETLRIEMGAGVGNFLTKILKKATDKHPLVFEGIRMNEYGELDAEALRSAIQGNLVDAYSQAFEWLIQEERTTLAGFLEKKRLDAIESGLQKILEKQRGKG